VPSHDFDKTHRILTHSIQQCPEGDLFETAGALNTALLKDELEQMEHEAEHDEL